MKSLIVRWIVILIVISLFLIGITLLIAPMIRGVGIFALTGYRQVDIQTYEQIDVYFDFDNGASLEDHQLLIHNRDVIVNRAIFWERASDHKVYSLIYESDTEIAFVTSFDGLESTIRRYDALQPLAMQWYVPDESLLIVHSDDAETVFYRLNLNSGNLTPLQALDFTAHSVFSDPNNRYFILRAPAINAKQAPEMVLLDLESGSRVNLGDSAFAYLSPDQSLIAVGYEADDPFELDVKVYDIQAQTFHDTGLTVPREDMAFFDQDTLSSLIWSGDSLSFALFNRDQGRVYHYHLNGAVAFFEGGELIPYAWSPDGRYLLTIGTDLENQYGAHVIDFREGTSQFIHEIGSSIVNFVWSTGSRSIAVMHLENPQLILSIYDVRGRVIRDEIDLNAVFGERVNPGNLRAIDFEWWLDR